MIYLLYVSIFSGGLFVIDILLIGGAIVFFYFALKASKSGSTIGGSSDAPLTESDINVPWYKTGQGIFCLVLLFFEILSIVWRIFDR